MEQKVTQESALPQLNAQLREVFEIPEQEIQSYSPLTLAYLGDAVYELIIRYYYVERGNAPVDKLHSHSSKVVNASAQSELIRLLEEELTEEELAVYKRGRNARPHTKAKNATTSDYKRATGCEALIGWLFLQGRWERLITLLHSGLEQLGYL